jgi:hypothetical protein
LEKIWVEHFLHNKWQMGGEFKNFLRKLFERVEEFLKKVVPLRKVHTFCNSFNSFTFFTSFASFKSSRVCKDLFGDLCKKIYLFAFFYFLPFFYFLHFFAFCFFLLFFLFWKVE